MQPAGFAQVGGLLKGGVAPRIVVPFVGVAAPGAAQHHQTAAGLLHQPNQFGVAGVGGQAGIPAHLDLGLLKGMAQPFGVFQRHIEAVVHKENLAQTVAGRNLRHFLNHFVNGPDDPPGALRRPQVVGRGGIVEPAQFGQHADAETCLGVFGHIQVVQAGAGAEIGGAAHPVIDDAAVFAVQHAGHSPVVGFPDFQAVGQFGEGFGGVAGDADVRLHELKNLLRHNAERRPAAHDSGIRNRAEALNDAFGDGQLPLRVNVAVVAQIADGNAHQVGVEIAGYALHLVQVVIAGKHQVNHLDAMAGAVNVAGHIGQPDGDGLGAHPAHHAVVAVGGNQQDTHLANPPRR